MFAHSQCHKQHQAHTPIQKCPVFLLIEILKVGNVVSLFNIHSIKTWNLEHNSLNVIEVLTLCYALIKAADWDSDVSYIAMCYQPLMRQNLYLQ